MKDQKLEDMLNFALSVNPEEREKTFQLGTGYDTKEKIWELIVKYSGDIQKILGEGTPIVKLLNEYAIIKIPEKQILSLTEFPEIEFVEKPKKLFFLVDQGRSASCINSVQSDYSSLGEILTGKGVLVACVDSGIDYMHPDFCNEDGTTRILRFWDQSIPGNPPEGYQIGTEYTREEINEALKKKKEIKSRDFSGHGTAVMGIAAGNGRASGGIYRGIAYESELIVVKLGIPQKDGFPRTTEMIQGIDYVIRQAIRIQKPVALNLSFGNNYGSHDGESLIENYIDRVANLGRSVICVGTGNEGDTSLHTSGKIILQKNTELAFQVDAYERMLNLQIWKEYVDEIGIVLIHPNGQNIGPLQENLGPQKFSAGSTEILLFYGKPSPFHVSQEIYIEFIPQNQYIDSGTWKIRFLPQRIVDGRYDAWMPGGNVLNTGTKFLSPTPETTLTIPSTARNVISVGAYDSRYASYAGFSGRGYTRISNEVKPDLAAPGVNIKTTSPGGKYTVQTGTSFSTPFVTGAAALLMEWGISKGNDPFLYGEKIKAYLRRGAKHLSEQDYPDEKLGYGVLCLRDSFPV